MAYGHPGVTAVDRAFAGGVYSPNQARIYLVPSRLDASGSWFFIDAAAAADAAASIVVGYAHGQGGSTAAANRAFAGGVYSPEQNRIYFAPYGQADRPWWHGVDCATGAVFAYAHPGATTVRYGTFRPDSRHFD